MTTDDIQLIQPTHNNLKEVCKHIVDHQIEGGNVTNWETTGVYWLIQNYVRQYADDFVWHQEHKPMFDRPLEYLGKSDDDEKLTLSLSEMNEYDGDEDMTKD